MEHKISIHDGTRAIPLSFATNADADAFWAWCLTTGKKAMHWHDDLTRLLAAFGEGVTTDEAVRRLDALRAAYDARENGEPTDGIEEPQRAACVGVTLDTLFAPYDGEAPKTAIASGAIAGNDHKEATR